MFVYLKLSWKAYTVKIIKNKGKTRLSRDMIKHLLCKIYSIFCKLLKKTRGLQHLLRDWTHTDEVSMVIICTSWDYTWLYSLSGQFFHRFIRIWWVSILNINLCNSMILQRIYFTADKSIWGSSFVDIYIWLNNGKQNLPTFGFL